MNESNMLTFFEALDEATEILQEKLQEPYLNSLASSLEMLHFGGTQQELSDDVVNKMHERFTNISIENYNKEEIRRAIQLLVLKGMQRSTQHQHAITPDAIALFIGYLSEKLFAEKKGLRIFDPVSGTGNLLLTVMDYLKRENSAYASEVDRTLLDIAVMYANMTHSEVEFFHQDSLRPFLLDPVDLVVADLPVGYYPDDVQASEYELQNKDGHSFSHYLLMEQALFYTKAGGFLILLIPENMFTGEASNALHPFLQKHAHIVGLLQLNEATFKTKEHKKSIFILQKKGPETTDVKQPLLAMLPSFKDTVAIKDVTAKINQWFEKAELD